MRPDPTFTPLEKRIIQIFLKKYGTSLSVDDIGDQMYRGKVRPKYWRGCVKAWMRTLTLKQTAGSARYIITRTSRLGRGSPAEYSYQPR